MDTETRNAIEVVRERLIELDRDLDQRIQRQISRSRVDLAFRIFLAAVVLYTVVMITLVVARAIYQ